MSFVLGAYGQKSDRDFVRRGNQLYQDSLFVKAEVEYRRALDYQHPPGKGRELC